MYSEWQGTCSDGSQHICALILLLGHTQADAFFRDSEVERPVLLSRLGVLHAACTVRCWSSSAESAGAPGLRAGMWVLLRLEAAECFLASPFMSPDLGFLISETGKVILTLYIYEMLDLKWEEDSSAALRGSSGVQQIMPFPTQALGWRRPPAPVGLSGRVCCCPPSDSLGPAPMEGEKLLSLDSAHVFSVILAFWGHRSFIIREQ